MSYLAYSIYYLWDSILRNWSPEDRKCSAKRGFWFPAHVRALGFISRVSLLTTQRLQDLPVKKHCLAMCTMDLWDFAAKKSIIVWNFKVSWTQKTQMFWRPMALFYQSPATDEEASLLWISKGIDFTKWFCSSGITFCSLTEGKVSFQKRDTLLRC